MSKPGVSTITSKRCPHPRHRESVDGPRVVTFEVPEQAVEAWADGHGAHLQVAFPMLSADDRERILTGYCPPCWDRLMGPE